MTVNKRLVMTRGIPGSGKSTLARELASRTPGAMIFSTDDYFTALGCFVPAKLTEAHQWNQLRAINAMIDGVPLVIIDNTNLLRDHIYPYVRPAVKLGYSVELVEPQTPWRRDAKACAEKTIHGVPLGTIETMLARFQPLTLDDILSGGGKS